MKIKLNWGKALILFFILFFIWSFSFVFFALRQNNDLVSDDHYQKGASFTTQINVDKRSSAYGDSIQIISSGTRLQISLCKSVAANSDSVQVYFFRSSDKRKDVILNFRAADSPFEIDRSKLFHGRYLVYITWGSKNENFMVKKTLDVE